MLTTYRRLAQAEFTKLRSLRSTGWTLAAMIVSTLGLAAIICAVNASQWSHFSAADKATWDPTNTSLSGTVFGQLAIGIFGVLAVTAEYASGTIRASVTAVPRRTPFLVAKAAVYGLVAFGIGELVSFASFWIGQALFAGHTPTASLATPGAFRAVALAGVYLALICLIGMGLGLVLRHTAGAISAIVALLLVLPPIIQVLPGNVQNSVGQFFPEAIAADSMGAAVREAHALSPVTGSALMVCYAVGLLFAGNTLLRRRDV